MQEKWKLIFTTHEMHLNMESSRKEEPHTVRELRAERREQGLSWENMYVCCVAGDLGAYRVMKDWKEWKGKGSLQIQFVAIKVLYLVVIAFNVNLPQIKSLK